MTIYMDRYSEGGHAYFFVPAIFGVQEGYGFRLLLRGEEEICATTSHGHAVYTVLIMHIHAT